MRHASRSSGLLHLEASWDMVFQFGLKTGGGAAQMVHVASSWRLHRVKGKDGWIDVMACVGPFYPNFVVFYVLGLTGILVFCSFTWTYKYDSKGMRLLVTSPTINL
jgi:hypothetical protein